LTETVKGKTLITDMRSTNTGVTGHAYYSIHGELFTMNNFTKVDK